MANETMTFKEAYRVLQGHAEKLRNQTEPNIDDLLSIVEESVSAYRVCKERIDAVEKALEKALTDVGAEASARSSGEESAERAVAVPRARAASSEPAPAVPARKGQNPSRGFDEMDDDIPFQGANAAAHQVGLANARLDAVAATSRYLLPILNQPLPPHFLQENQ